MEQVSRNKTGIGILWDIETRMLYKYYLFVALYEHFRIFHNRSMQNDFGMNNEDMTIFYHHHRLVMDSFFEVISEQTMLAVVVLFW